MFIMGPKKIESIIEFKNNNKEGELYKGEGIEFSLNEDAKKSFDGLLIGIENGFVISEKEFVENEIRNFISLFEYKKT